MVNVVLVDKHGQEVGLLEKANAHRNPGFLHKAISVVLWRPSKQNPKQKEVLLQKRSEHKPLWPGFWTDTCSTHQLPGESDIDCAVRRLQEEMGIAINPNKLSVLYAYRYQADFDDYLSEHELNHVIVGEWDDELDFNRDEVEEVQWIRWDELVKDVHQQPSKYADWFVLMVKNERLQKEFEI
jgi:isopentenyl-diphosphate delta-isomerase